MFEIVVNTRTRSELLELTEEVQAAVTRSGIAEGFAFIFIPHTTAGITINENADPDVKRDMLRQLDEMVPWSQPFYRHGEGNSAAHVKASMLGSSVTVPIKDGRLMLGTWQGILLAEFDGPRTRKIYIRISG